MLNVWCATVVGTYKRKHEIAAALGVTPQTFARWVTGRGRPDIISALHIQNLSDGTLAAKIWYSPEIAEARDAGYDLFLERA